MQYELDRLGWHNFEWLCQTWLKAEFGFAVEAFGGSKDQGRDAYASFDIKNHSGQLAFSGPVVFQAKFVSQANAAGANYRSSLIDACQAERKRIDQRTVQGIWKPPATYVLLTNCPVAASVKLEVGTIFTGTAHSTIILGSTDLSQALDLRPEIARAFPQILSYQNLVSLIQASLARPLAQRSLAALKSAEDIIPVFVPTHAYDKAWALIKSKHFVVLTGPPEMGKTSIGWMIAMSQLANGWQICDCSSPEDFFKVYDFAEKQFFLADDAFGRTEFQVTKGNLWEADLHKVLERLDSNHLLAWTSRKHILERATKQLDLQGKAKNFPSPAEVLVQADKLDYQEKALILYRHAANAGLEPQAKLILKSHLKAIVNDPHFTPERIRRFTRRELPLLAKEHAAGTLKPEHVTARVEAAIEQYTSTMKKSFTSLSDEHKWLLITLLDENLMKVAQIESGFKSLSPVPSKRPMIDLLRELDESFIRWKGEISGPIAPFVAQWAWIHPSYRDLIIDALREDRSLRERYLKFGGLASITLALSQAGGKTGERELPLLLDSESWNLLGEACKTEISVNKTHVIEQLIENLLSTLKGSTGSYAQLCELAEIVCLAFCQRWDGLHEAIPNGTLEAFFVLSDYSPHYIAPPDLTVTWEEAWDATRKLIYEPDDLTYEQAEQLSEWVELVKIIKSSEPRFLRKMGFLFVLQDVLNNLSSLIKHQVMFYPQFDEVEQCREEIERMREMGKAVETLTTILAEAPELLSESGKSISRRINALEEDAQRLSPAEYEPDREDGESSSSEGFNIDELFADL